MLEIVDIKIFGNKVVTFSSPELLSCYETLSYYETLWISERMNERTKHNKMMMSRAKPVMRRVFQMRDVER